MGPAVDREPQVGAGLGLVLPTFPQDNAVPSAVSLAETCRAAEQAGAAGLWACDHLFWHGPNLECLATLAVAAAATHSVRIGPCVLQLPLRSMPATAKELASLQELSGNRVVLGVGVGSHAGEYEAAGVAYAQRGALLDEALADLRALWRDRPYEAADRYRQRPSPAHMPVWVGGTSKAARRRAAANQGWIPLFVPPADYGAELEAIRSLARQAGGDETKVEGAIVVFVSMGGEAAADRGRTWMSSLYGLPPHAFERHLLAGSAAQVAGELSRYVEAGAGHVAVFVTEDDPTDSFAELASAFGHRWGLPATGRDGPGHGQPEARDSDPVRDTAGRRR